MRILDKRKELSNPDDLDSILAEESSCFYLKFDFHGFRDSRLMIEFADDSVIVSIRGPFHRMILLLVLATQCL